MHILFFFFLIFIHISVKSMEGDNISDFIRRCQMQGKEVVDGHKCCESSGFGYHKCDAFSENKENEFSNSSLADNERLCLNNGLEFVNGKCKDLNSDKVADTQQIQRCKESGGEPRLTSDQKFFSCKCNGSDSHDHICLQQIPGKQQFIKLTENQVAMSKKCGEGYFFNSNSKRKECQHKDTMDIRTVCMKSLQFTESACIQGSDITADWLDDVKNKIGKASICTLNNEKVAKWYKECRQRISDCVDACSSCKNDIACANKFEGCRLSLKVLHPVEKLCQWDNNGTNPFKDKDEDRALLSPL